MEMENVVDLEDGEIDDSDDSNSLDDIYTPLERPDAISHQQPIPIITEPNEVNDDHTESESESDSEDGERKKIAKQKKKIIQQNIQNSSNLPKRKKYTIWCNDAADEALSNNLKNCNVDLSNERTRDVESYNHKLAYTKGHNNSKKKSEPSNKRNFTGRCISSAKRKFRQKVATPAVELTCRIILPLVKDVSSSNQELAEDIANKLMEEKEQIVCNVIETLGKEKTIELYEQTVQVEKNGGLLIMNGSRRRTPGGVFFHLLKSFPGIEQEHLSSIFSEDRRLTSREMKKARAVKRRQAISKEDYPTLLSKAEAAIFKKKEKVVDEEGVKNPPPSPATDGRENSSDGEDAEHLLENKTEASEEKMLI